MPELDGWRPSAADLTTIAERIRVKLSPDAPRLLRQIAEATAAAPTAHDAAGTLYLYCVMSRPADEASGFLALEYARVLLMLTGRSAGRIDRARAESLLADVETGVLTDVGEIGRRLKDL